MPQCSKRAVEGGLVIRTFTGPDDHKVICTIGPSKDIKHIVWVKNLRTYPTRIECTSEIVETGALVFEQLHERDSKTRWSATYGLDSGELHRFPRVGLLSLKPGGNEQKIVVELVVERVHRGTTERVAVSIFVQP